MRQSVPGRRLLAMGAGGVSCDAINCITFLNVRVNAAADFAGLWDAPFGAHLADRFLWVPRL